MAVTVVKGAVGAAMDCFDSLPILVSGCEPEVVVAALAGLHASVTVVLWLSAMECGWVPG